MPFPVLSPSRALALGLSAVLLVSLGACGRKGPLEPPPGAVAAKPDPLAQPEDDPNAARTIADTYRAEHGEPITPAQLRTRLGVALPLATAAHAQL